MAGRKNNGITLKAARVIVWAFPLAAFYAVGAEIEGRAVLPAQSTYENEAVSSFVALVPNSDGSFEAATAAAEDGRNPAEVHLRVYRIRPELKSGPGEPGSIKIESVIELSDPNAQIPFPIVESFGPKRRLTAADFAIQSMQRAPDGSYWFGDGLGPFLIHTDAAGKVLEPPFELTDMGKPIRTRSSPHFEEASVVRIMNAFRFDARAHGSTKMPVASPDADLVDDGDPATAVKNRVVPDPGNGVEAASSEIFNVQTLHAAGFQVIPYTVNDKNRMLQLLRLKVNGIISDRPDLLHEALKEFDADGDGKPGDLVDADGLIDPQKFSAQAHRGGRNLRPENTIPAMEMGLDSLVNTLETDCGLTADHTPVLSHDPFLPCKKCRHADDTRYEERDQVLIEDCKLADLQKKFIGDKCLSDRPSQRNERCLSPVSLAFFEKEKVSEIYQIPSLDQLFRFVKFYKNYYEHGPGRTHPEAVARWKNAARVRFNIETKINPRTDADAEQLARGEVPFCDRTTKVEILAKEVAEVIKAHEMMERADIQSFDFRPLRYVHEHYPQIRTVFLFGDFPKYKDRTHPDSDDGTNLQDEQGRNTPWLAGLCWPYRVTTATSPARASDGITGLALASDSKHLLILLGRSLPGDDKNAPVYEFDFETKTFTRKSQYPLEANVFADGLVASGNDQGFVLETDRATGRDGLKAIYAVEFATGKKNQIADLVALCEAKNQKAPIALGKVAGLTPMEGGRLLLVNSQDDAKSVRSKPAKPTQTELISIRLGPATAR